MLAAALHRGGTSASSLLASGSMLQTTRSTAARSLSSLSSLVSSSSTTSIVSSSSSSLASVSRSTTAPMALPRLSSPPPTSLPAPSRRMLSQAIHRHLASGNRVSAFPPPCARSASTDAAKGAEKPAGAAAAEEAATSGAEEAKQEGQQQQQQQQEEAAFEEEIPYEDEPFMAKLSRFVWTTIKVSIAGSIIAVVLYAGWTIVVTLAPSGTSANAIMRKASDILKHDPELATYFGEMKTYGEDFGGSREGRRYFVPEYEYTDDTNDTAYKRVRFNLEGERGKKATVWAELRSGSSNDFRYLIVLAKDRSRVWSVVDHRPPERSIHERQASVTTLLQDAGWTFYADNEVDMSEQASQLGDYWLKVKTVRCDLDRDKCEKEGITAAVRPAWTMGLAPSPGLWSLVTDGATKIGNTIGELTGISKTSAGTPAKEAGQAALEASKWRIAKGVKALDELERMTKELRLAQARAQVQTKEAGAMGAVGVSSIDSAIASVKRALGMA